MAKFPYVFEDSFLELRKKILVCNWDIAWCRNSKDINVCFASAMADYVVCGGSEASALVSDESGAQFIFCKLAWISSPA